MKRIYHIGLASIVCFTCYQAYGYWNSLSLQIENKFPPQISPIFTGSSIKQVAIIGAGPAGSSTAYYLRQFANKAGIQINITIFERNNYIGGRVTTVNVYNDPLEPTELGSTLFTGINAILKNATEAFGLELDSTVDDRSLGVWNGNEIVYIQGDETSLLDLLKLIIKFGASPERNYRLKQKIINNFLKLYEYPYFPFQSLTSRIHDLELDKATGVTGMELLEKNHIVDPYRNNVIQASTRVAYGQNLDVMHGVQTMVCMAIDDAMAIKGGNAQIFQEMIKASNASTAMSTTANSIVRPKDKAGYNISWSKKRNDGTNKTDINTDHFDSVVLATPLQHSNIFLEPGMLRNVPENIPYARLHVTLFTSPHQLNPRFFNYTDDKKLPEMIISTLPPDRAHCHSESDPGYPGFFAISRVRPTINPSTRRFEYLYKIFSYQSIDAELLSRLLNITVDLDLSTSADTISWYYPYIWDNAYPYAYPRVKFDDTELASGLWYTSGIESFISTMETSALMGMNVARLMVDEFLGALQGTVHQQL